MREAYTLRSRFGFVKARGALGEAVRGRVFEQKNPAARSKAKRRGRNREEAESVEGPAIKID